jgi:hypothetical protein
MASIWESMGERVGYALAAIVLGPAAALQRQARRRTIRAVVLYCEEYEPTELEAPKGVLRRGARLPTISGPISIEIELRAFEGRATLSLTITALPSHVNATVSRAAWEVQGLLSRLPAPLAREGTLRVDSETLDVETARALLDVIAKGPLATLNAMELEIRREQIDVHVVAPSTLEQWKAIGEGVVTLEAWLTSRWSSSYRG